MVEVYHEDEFKTSYGLEILALEDALDTEFYESMVDDLVLYEASSTTYILFKALYPLVEKALSTREGDRTFKKLIIQYIDRNSSKLSTSGPVYKIIFGETDKAGFYQLFGITEEELQKYVKEMTMTINASNFTYINAMPLTCLFYMCTRYYMLNNDEKGLELSLNITILASYWFIFNKYFKYEANPNVMQYTIDNLTDKFLFKTNGTLFGALKVTVQNAYTFHQKFFKDASDKEIIHYLQRLRNSLNSLIKKVCNEYLINHKKGLSVTTQLDTSDENGPILDKNMNNTSVVESISRKVVLGMINQHVVFIIADIAAKMTQVSSSDCISYLTNIMTTENSAKLDHFVESILFLFLYEGGHQPREINSTGFLNWSLELFRKTNANNANIKNIKDTLDFWAEETGIHDKFKREASRVNYKKAIFLYVVISIQKLSND